MPSYWPRPRRRPSAARVVLLLVVLVLVGIVLLLVGAFDTSEPSGAAGGHAGGDPSSSGGSPSPASPDPASASPTPAASTPPSTIDKLLATLPIKGRAPMTGYARVADFGTAWKDVNHNGCDTRNDILARDLTHIVKSGSCTVRTGILVSPYTGATIDFVRGVGTSTRVQIDHMVSLGDAWQTGAQKLTQSKRESLANDPLNLVAVDGSSNEQKGDGDAATWLPHNKAYRCTYVTHQVEVKAKYGLWVTRAEHDAIARILAKCAA